MYTRYNRAASRRHYHVNCISKKIRGKLLQLFNETFLFKCVLCIPKHVYSYMYVRVTHNQCCIIRMPTHVLTIPNTQTKLYSPLVQFTYTLIYLHAHAHTHIR